MFRLRLHGGFSLTDDRGTEIAVKSQKAKALLAYLARPLGKARSREEIVALLWSDRAEAQGRASLRQVLTGLRKDLGAPGALSISDEEISLDPERVAIEPPRNGEEFLARFHLRDPAFEDWLRDERQAGADGATSRRPSSGSSVAKPSIAVLPFVNLSGDPEQQYFSDGITEDIITELNRFQSLFVIAGSSSFAFRDRDVDVADVGQKLGAQFVVQGSVRKAGERLRISVQLIDAATSGHEWSDRYDREITDVFTIQDEIASTVATMVSGHIDLVNRVRSERKHPRDVDAYDLVLRADWLNYNDFTSVEAMRLFERAIEIDPGYAAAHAKLAVAHSYRGFVEALDSKELAPIVVRHGSEAAGLAPGDAMVHGPLSMGYALVGEHELALHHLERAMSINPNGFMIMTNCAEAMALLGQHERALALIEKAMLRDPFAALSYRENQFDICYLAGLYQTALDQLFGWPDPPIHMALAKAAALAQLGRIADAKAVFSDFEARRPDGWDPRIVAQNYYLMCARPKDGERWLEGFRKAGVDV